MISQNGPGRASAGCRLVCALGFIVALAIWQPLPAAQLVEVSVLDRDIVVVHFSDGEVIHDEAGAGEIVIRHTPELDMDAATTAANWTLTSPDDSNYGGAGRHPQACHRKTTLSGHAQMEWIGSDFRYESIFDHWIYLRMPESLHQGASYTLAIDPATNSDSASAAITFDVAASRSEAVHVNLVGYAATAPHKAADLYHWMGDGGARDYTGFEGNTVWLYDVDSGQLEPVGTVAFWMADGADAFGYDFTRSDVWRVDLSAAATPGTYRLVVEGVGCSQDFEIADDVYADPFLVAVRGYFYMRIGESNAFGLSPPPREPLYLPGVDPPSTTVYLTTMHPWHPEWTTFSSGDVWDRPEDWAAYRPAGHPTNAEAWGGHSDAADWDRHLAHVANIHDLLLPYLLTGGVLNDDDLGITESGNGIPDLLEEVRYEVDFWLRLRDGDGYSHGLTNPDGGNRLFQAGPTAVAAWANAVNAAALADAFRLAGLTTLMDLYRDAAVAAYNHADGLADPMLDEGIGLDEGFLRGRDLKMIAAAHLYNVTGETDWEDVVASESVCGSGPADLVTTSHHQLWPTAAYLVTPRDVHHPTLHADMRAAVIAEAWEEEAGLIDSRPSRRATERGPASFWRTAHAVTRTILAHAVTGDPADRDHFRKALALEADWGLGRNPLNTVEMSTATTPLGGLRSYEELYTSGRDDGVDGVHPGHTPYLNLTDWAPAMVMGRPSALYEDSHPGSVPATWPIGECAFPSRWVWAHSEFTPRQTMRGKAALYGYLYGLAAAPPPPNPILAVEVLEVAGGQGSVTSVPAGIGCGSDCQQAYVNGTHVELTASPAEGSRFAGWDGACAGDQATCGLTMTFNRSAAATFEPEGLVYTLSVATVGDGAVTSQPAGIDCGGDCSEAFASGAAVELFAAPASGFRFSGWSGDCSGTGQCIVSMTADRSVTAEFGALFVPEVMIYQDALASGWQDWSWNATVDLAATSPSRPGSSHVVNATLGAWGGFSPATVSAPMDTLGYHALAFWGHGGPATVESLTVSTEGSGGESDQVPIVLPTGVWTEFVIPLAEFGNPAEVSRLNVFNASGGTLGTFSLDDIRLVPSGLFMDGFESGGLAAWSWSD